MKYKQVFLTIVLSFVIFIFTGCHNSNTGNLENNHTDLGSEEKEYYIEVYDGKVVVGEHLIEEFYQLTTVENKKATLNIKQTTFLHEDKCSEEYYQEHQDEYPKETSVEVCYNGKDYSYSYDGQKARTYNYFKCEKVQYKNENDGRDYHTEYYLVNDETVTYSYFISLSYSSTIVEEWPAFASILGVDHEKNQSES